MATTVPDWLTSILAGANSSTAAILAAAAGIAPGSLPAGTELGALAPAAPAEPPPDPLAGLRAVVGKSRAQAVADALASRGQSMDDRTPGAARAAEKFGGDVLAFGSRPTQGHMGDFATVLRDGKLWHVYSDGRKMKLDDGAVARALGITPKVGALQVVGGHPAGEHGHASNHSRQPANPNGTGGVRAPSADSGDWRALSPEQRRLGMVRWRARMGRGAGGAIAP